MTRTNRGPLGKRLFKAWLAASAVYVVLIGGLSVKPVGEALVLARQPYVAPPAVHHTGPDNPPETPTMRAAEIIGRQALIGLAPPLLILWFGWDAWFAITGFLNRRGEPEEAGD